LLTDNPLHPRTNIGLNGFPVPDTDNPNLGLNHFEYDPIITHAKLPVALQRLSQGLAVFVRRFPQPFFNGLADSVFGLSVNERQIVGADGRMIAKRKGHGSFPHVFMRQCLLDVENLHPLIGKSC